MFSDDKVNSTKNVTNFFNVDRIRARGTTKYDRTRKKTEF